VTATTNQPGFGRSCPCTKTRARYSVGNFFRYLLDVLCARDLKERQKENTMAHAHSQTPSNKMNENCLPQRCSQSYISLAPLFTDGLEHSCVRLQLLVYDHKTDLSAVTHAPRIAHLLLAVICITIQPARLTACCSHMQAGMRPHAHTKARLECRLCRGRQRKHHRVRPQKRRLHHPPPSYPPVSQCSIVNTKTATDAATQHTVMHQTSAIFTLAPQRCHPWDCGGNLAVENNRHLCRPALTMTTPLLSPSHPWLLQPLYRFCSLPN